jgi:hypothetical protein
MASTDELRARRLVSRLTRLAAEGVADDCNRRSCNREGDVSNRWSDASFSESALLFSKPVSRDESDARTIENDAFAIVGVTFGLQKATSCFEPSPSGTWSVIPETK